MVILLALVAPAAGDGLVPLELPIDGPVLAAAGLSVDGTPLVAVADGATVRFVDATDGATLSGIDDDATGLVGVADGVVTCGPSGATWLPLSWDGDTLEVGAVDRVTLTLRCTAVVGGTAADGRVAVAVPDGDPWLGTVGADGPVADARPWPWGAVDGLGPAGEDFGAWDLDEQLVFSPADDSWSSVHLATPFLAVAWLSDRAWRIDGVEAALRAVDTDEAVAVDLLPDGLWSVDLGRPGLLATGLRTTDGAPVARLLTSSTTLAVTLPAPVRSVHGAELDDDACPELLLTLTDDALVALDQEPCALGVDRDGDGYTTDEGDCDDDDDSRHPGAEEHCDDIDQDCDGRIERGDDVVWSGIDWFDETDAVITLSAGPADCSPDSVELADASPDDRHACTSEGDTVECRIFDATVLRIEATVRDDEGRVLATDLAQIEVHEAPPELHWTSEESLAQVGAGDHFEVALEARAVGAHDEVVVRLQSDVDWLTLREDSGSPASHVQATLIGDVPCTPWDEETAFELVAAEVSGGSTTLPVTLRIAGDPDCAPEPRADDGCACGSCASSGAGPFAPVLLLGMPLWLRRRRGR
ncbi:MAG: putative metal-binding motif-containing protein [Alphaproteobacteria bacterium]|nr:putative metal-binding motif-containing protein [Alphaproteobacteria bacterium]